ncbi:MAG: hypothetical protein H7Y42_10125 [Chitinophagaceae bacterium]|nr:hypothetical protein [Chitinophagaceae bacterium]
MPTRIIVFILSIAIISLHCQREMDIPLPPPIEGFGAVTAGGSGLQVVHVTNLNRSGDGSLYQAMGSNRIIVFDVAGTIEHFSWDSSNEVPVFNLTIDGTTAPSPGITIDNGGSGNGLSFQDGCHDIIVKSIRVRNAGNDGINVVNGYNMVFDHISVSGSGDGNFDMTAGAHNISVQYSIIGPGQSTWSGAMLIAYEGTKDLSVHHNLFNSRSASGVGERNPLVHCVDNINTDNLMLDFRCNVVWNWGNNGGTSFGYGTGIDYGGTANIINNFYQTSGIDAESAVDFNHNSTNARGFVSGNVSGNTTVDPNRLSNHPLWPIPTEASVTTQSACAAASIVIGSAGCRPLDATDQALVKSVSLANCH